MRSAQWHHSLSFSFSFSASSISFLPHFLHSHSHAWWHDFFVDKSTLHYPVESAELANPTDLIPYRHEYKWKGISTRFLYDTNSCGLLTLVKALRMLPKIKDGRKRCVHYTMFTPSHSLNFQQITVSRWLDSTWNELNDACTFNSSKRLNIS